MLENFGVQKGFVGRYGWEGLVSWCFLADGGSFLVGLMFVGEGGSIGWRGLVVVSGWVLGVDGCWGWMGTGGWVVGG